MSHQFIRISILTNNTTDLKHWTLLCSTKVVKECYTETNVTCIVYVGVIFLMALHEFLLYPLFHLCIQCHTRIKSLWKVIVGTALLILKIIMLAILDIISRHTILSYRGQNATLQCAFNRNPTGIPGKNLSLRWLAIAQYLYYTSLAFTLVGIIEFICSQVPYSMKGIVIGEQYTLALVCSVESVPMIGLLVLFKRLDLSTWSKGTISCEFWYALIVVTVNLAVFFTLMWLANDTRYGKGMIYCPMSTFLLKDITLHDHKISSNNTKATALIKYTHTVSLQ